MDRLLPPQDVLVAHAAVHGWCEDRTYDAIGRLVDVDVAGARSALDDVARVLEEHMAFEEARVMPAYRALAPADGPGRADHVDGDHTILRRHLDAIAALLDELDALAPAERTRRAALERLPVVYRLLATLEHHTAREQQHVYPAVLAAMDDAARTSLHAALERAIPAARA